MPSYIKEIYDWYTERSKNICWSQLNFENFFLDRNMPFNWISRNMKKISLKIRWRISINWKRNQVIEGTMSRAKLVLIYLKAIELYQWYLWIYAKSIYRSHCNFERKLSNRSRVIQRQNILENHPEIFVLWYRSDGLPCGVDHETIRIKICFL